MVRIAWNVDCIGSAMFKVASKIKNCGNEHIKWNREQENNSGLKIQILKKAMEDLRGRGNRGDGALWNDLKHQLDVAYKEDEVYWSQKALVHWLQKGDKNSSFFYASVVQRWKCNKMAHLEKEQRGEMCV